MRPRRHACSPRPTAATLEPDVLADVAARTEGWAASLQLVQAALRDRSPAEIRQFVRGLSGADQELYDYLAEEVVGDLPEDLQQFLMRTSILQVVTPRAGRGRRRARRGRVAAMTTAAERLTLLSRPPRVIEAAPQRYHPLVREFLEARLRADDRRRGRGRAPPTRGATRPRRPTGASPPTTTARPATSCRGRLDDRRRDPRDHGRRPARRRDRGDRPRPERRPARRCSTS